MTQQSVFFSSDYDVSCRPAHGFTHVLKVTENMTEFKRVIQKQRIAGNMDTPEGGFDAMLQAAVCQVNTETEASDVSYLINLISVLLNKLLKSNVHLLYIMWMPIYIM